jgi:hypothetical protein
LQGETYVYVACGAKCPCPFHCGSVSGRVGLFFFSLYGAFLGSFEDRIVAWQLKEVKAHPQIKQSVEGQPATSEQAADKAWERIKFAHGHGFVMVLAAFASLLLIANSTKIGVRIKSVLMWVSLVAMVLYNVGWALAGWLVPFVGAEEAKEFGEVVFFAPLGLTIVTVAGVIAVAYAREALAIIRQSAAT